MLWDCIDDFVLEFFEFVEIDGEAVNDVIVDVVYVLADLVQSNIGVANLHHQTIPSLLIPPLFLDDGVFNVLNLCRNEGNLVDKFLEQLADIIKCRSH